MGRHSAPKGRLSLRLGVVEAVLAIAFLVVTIAGLLTGMSTYPAAEKLLRDGRCVTAQVTASWSFRSFRFGRSATLAYVLDGRRRSGTLHYDEDRLAVGSTVTVCTDHRDPMMFAAQVGQGYGTSTNLWLRAAIGLPVSGAAFAGLIVLLGTHEWRA